MPEITDLALPSDADLRRLVQFSSRDGRIWLAGQRMLLVHAAALGGLRRELMRTIGPEHTRRVLLRAGYASGQRDAELARSVRGARSPEDLFNVGIQLHMLEGVVQIATEELDIDVGAGRLSGKFRCDHSWEAEMHVRDFGHQTVPVCWMLQGYAAGYCSTFMGRPMLVKEYECQGCGHAHCRTELRPAEDWPDGEAMLAEFQAESMLVRLADLQEQVETLRSTLQPADEMGPLIGQSRAFMETTELLRKAAPTQVTVLLTGETGVGKERFARALHAMSPRAAKPFVAVNCAALPAELIESELFGAEKGAYTGAASARPGRFERADGGTLMLDELGELPLTAQAKLLRVLQRGEIERLGSSQVRKVDVRVIAATNVNLEEAVAQGRFRSDLFYRLNVYPIRIPPLRERAEDIEPLATHLLQRFSALHGKPLQHFTDRALDAMRSHSWPGNVRELENLVERGVILSSPGEAVDVGNLFPAVRDARSATVNARGQLEPSAPADAASIYDEVIRRGLTLDALEDILLREAAERAGGNLAAAGRTLGLTRPQMSYRVSRLQERSGE
jgi:DNA-binding NtrC family response regulator/predicted hydrocarbon binding protein